MHRAEPDPGRNVLPFSILISLFVSFKILVPDGGYISERANLKCKFLRSLENWILVLIW